MFLDKELEQILDKALGPLPTATGSMRRWDMLRRLAEFIHDNGPLSFNDLLAWTIPNLECLNLRTLRENYVGTLKIAKLIEVDKHGLLVWTASSKTRPSKRSKASKDSAEDFLKKHTPSSEGAKAEGGTTA
jgi:hypothetical protein